MLFVAGGHFVVKLCFQVIVVHGKPKSSINVICSSIVSYAIYDSIIRS
jgi:hypothetical protein